MPLLLFMTACFSATETLSLFDDLALTRGFRLSAVRSSMHPVEVGNVLALDASSAPAWRLAQWGTRFSLEGVPEKTKDGGRILANAGKSLTIYPGGLSGEGLRLEVLGSAEYGGKLRQYGEEWPHLLIEQSLTPLPLNTLDRLEFAVSFQVEHCAPATALPLDPGLHTAHITAFWTLHNRNEQSRDYNNMIWFGLPLFDARYPVPPGHQAVDRGQPDASGKFIYTVAGERLWSAPIALGDWHTLSSDMLPLLREALAAAQGRGFLTDTLFADLHATSFNLGWEVPGPYDCAIRLRAMKWEAHLAK
jgi:hypothetical protein